MAIAFYLTDIELSKAIAALKCIRAMVSCQTDNQSFRYPFAIAILQVVLILQ